MFSFMGATTRNLLGAGYAAAAVVAVATAAFAVVGV